LIVLRNAFVRLRTAAGLGAGLLAFSGALPVVAQQAVTVRTPATPLVAHDPYFSIWSFGDGLAAKPTMHWTGSDQQLNAFLRVDGKVLRFMGGGEGKAMMQQSRGIWPTRTVYEFEDAGVHLTVGFFTPALPDDLDVLSRPLTYLNWTARSVDGRNHAVQLYVDASAQLAVDTLQQPVVWGSNRVGDMTVMRIGTGEQAVLRKSGDNVRADWGWAELAVPQQPGTATAMVGEQARNAFVKDGGFAAADDLAMPRSAGQDLPVMVARFDLGSVGAAPVTRRAMLAYDAEDAIEYFKRRLPPYWRRGGMTMAELLQRAEAEEPALRRRGEAFDRQLTADLERVGGRDYADIAVLAYRQTLAAHKLVADIDGTPLLFSKENFSGGYIDTVDVTYPSSPFFLLFNPRLLEAQLRPIMDYAALARWHFPFAPHDLGFFPLANGQLYGGGERTEDDQMPVEETGNMLIMIAALAKIEGNADFAARYWPQISRWAAYLREKGLDPENQLSTDDFAGHLTHNANLAIKAILALDSYADLARTLHKRNEAASYHSAAQAMAAKWSIMARDGDHTKLAFDRPGSWSQKYNLVWDKVLGFDLFPKALLASETRFYLQHQQSYGLPLDSRKTYTKLDWITWSATLADSKAEFEALVAPAHRYMVDSPTRVPLSDWYETIDAKQVGFQARSVVGGVYMKMLATPDVWRAWAHRASAK
jgi:hypothetical protein